MLNEFIELEEESDESYRCYTLQNTVQIFKHCIQDEDLNDVRIYVSTNTPLDSIVHKIEDYIKWFSTCETVFRDYYENELHEKVHQNWFNEIEVYRVDITFNSVTDYGATISCGDHILRDHIMIIDFDREQIQAIHLNG
ncbi:hypothetical protein CXK86_03925 [Paenibacillus sp. BGI2013]|uniref:hypothetical protein n=1 Tax=Paenibacillus sp. BGI2013 TaxID=2058902 RepID=UPI000C6E02A1|nr:hypothetical protein [Paenibacillus sp. BGI2013]PKQ93264.1 hypothetical protein CXK86_03925 [Paenibacillus sp. BGI2013]